MVKTIYNCAYCHKKINRYASNVRNAKKVYCSVDHKNLDSVGTNTGINNPNFNNKWTTEQKKKQSDLIKSKVDDEYRFNVGTANRGKKFSASRCKNIADGHRGKKNYMYGKTHTDSAKKKIGIKSKEKWTEEYKQKNRKIREDRGQWIKTEDKSEWEIYQKESNWIDKMFDICNDDEQKLLKEHGVFNSKSNSKGLVRDHKLSRWDGFIAGIPPELLRHPCNCQIISHADNSSKRRKSSLTLKELCSIILIYNREWKEQYLCRQIIKERNF